jgi:hypothetical protein
MTDDPVLTAMQKQLAGFQVILRRIDDLERLLNQMFARMRQIEDAHARLLTERPVPPAPPRPH